MIELLNIDCREYMSKCENKTFDLAIVDPPYGIGPTWTKSKKDTMYLHRSKYTNHEKVTKEFIDELFRVSNNQIIFGFNYFSHLLPETNSIIIWDKVRDVEKTFMSEAELAWTSYKIPCRIFRYQWDGAKKCGETGTKKIHPFQKPVALYKWILKKYARKNMRIIDTHLGSASSAIAAYYFGCDFVGCESDEIHYSTAVKRFNNETLQTQARFLNSPGLEQTVMSEGEKIKSLPVTVSNVT